MEYRYHDGKMLPRFIAAGYLYDGKDIDWVKTQCKKWEEPEKIFKWVKIYVTTTLESQRKHNQQTRKKT